LKGIFPREPKKAPKGKDKTYYLRKDVMYIMHDPLLPKLREYRAWKKKVKKYKDKRMPEKVDQLKKQKPRYSLAHVVKERYPTFQDALRDLDDALSTVFLFANMPSTEKIHASRVGKCQQLAKEFQFYIVKTNSLRKVFLSTKGIYFQAEVYGQTITWVVPYHFTQKIVKDVDYKVMMTFLEFYEVLMGYVNFKLFHDLNFTYPPKFDVEKDSNAEGFDAIVDELKAAASDLKGPIITKKKESAKEKEKRVSALNDVVKDIAAQEESSESDDDDDSDDDDESEHEESEGEESEGDEPNLNENWNAGKNAAGELDTFGDDETSRRIKENSIYSNLFAKYHFFLNREVPREAFEFVIKAFGGRVSWENPLTPNSESDLSITHHVIDRPTVSNRLVNRDYVQPQWVIDSINAKVLIPVDEYIPGHKLPPHLSPFVDDAAEGYIPDYRKRLDSYYAQANGGILPSGSSVPTLPLDEGDSESEEDEEKFNAELEEEQKGNYGKPNSKTSNSNDKPNARTPTKAQKRAREDAEDEAQQQETASALLPNKKRRLLERIKYSKRMKQEEIDKLENKKKKLEEGSATIREDGVIVYQPVVDKDGDAVMSDD
jgi:pescadillo protein